MVRMLNVVVWRTTWTDLDYFIIQQTWNLGPIWKYENFDETFFCVLNSFRMILSKWFIYRTEGIMRSVWKDRSLWALVLFNYPSIHSNLKEIFFSSIKRFCWKLTEDVSQHENYDYVKWLSVLACAINFLVNKFSFRKYFYNRFSLSPDVYQLPIFCCMQTTKVYVKKGKSFKYRVKVEKKNWQNLNYLTKNFLFRRSLNLFTILIFRTQN